MLDLSKMDANHTNVGLIAGIGPSQSISLKRILALQVDGYRLVFVPHRAIVVVLSAERIAEFRRESASDDP